LAIKTLVSVVLLVATVGGVSQTPNPVSPMQTTPPVAQQNAPVQAPPVDPAAAKAAAAKSAAAAAAPVSKAAVKSVMPTGEPVGPKQLAFMRARLADWPQLSRYRAENATLPPPAKGEERVVFFGASMTEFWGKYGSSFFPGKPYVNRGISGQTTAQMVARFRQDVINLHPKAVVILGGTNDIAGNTGQMTPEMTEANWQTMADLARENGIRVIFASLTPSTEFGWHKGLKPAEKIRSLNAWLQGYCSTHSLTYLDYYSVLTNADGGMRVELSADGVHANPKGYTLMAPLAQAAIDKTLAN
jgi:lysophospholipase L1-like esterase